MNKIITITLLSFLTALHSVAQKQDPVLNSLMPKIPSSLTATSQRANYLALHYWDNFDFLDTVKLSHDRLLERCFVDFISLLSIVPKDTVELAVNALMKRAEIDPDAVITFAMLGEKYLYESDSPLNDEEKFIPFLRYMLSSRKVSEANKIRPRFLLEDVLKNRPGNVAADFTYMLINGKTGTLHRITADYTLLFFKNPACEECNKMTKQLTSSSTVNDRVNRGTLKILTVYLFDDVNEWKEHAPSVPNTWIYARNPDEKIIGERIYDVRRFPTVYLLDKNKKVILKDVSFEKLENYLKELKS
jgi:hypothetical protein